MKKIVIFLTIFNIGVCIESLFRVGFSIMPIIIATLLLAMMIIGVKLRKRKNKSVVIIKSVGCENDGVRHLDYPKDGKRVESGVVQFGKDWTALHLRGDDCMALKLDLHKMLEDDKNRHCYAAQKTLRLIDKVFGGK
jgi:hypothetical protein